MWHGANDFLQEKAEDVSMRLHGSIQNEDGRFRLCIGTLRTVGLAVSRSDCDCGGTQLLEGGPNLELSLVHAGCWETPLSSGSSS